MSPVRAAPALVVTALCAASLPAIAAEPCGGSFWKPEDIPSLTLGAVKAAEKRVYFVDGEAEACPSAAPACRLKEYLVGGDTVVIEDRSGDFVCASYVNAKGRLTVGWLPASAIDAPAATPLAKPGDFLGRWRSTSASIIITQGKRDLLAIEGEATYPTAGGSVNLGDLAADAAPKYGELYFGVDAEGNAVPPDEAGEFDCVVRLKRLGPYLVAADNLNCGGHNVTFSGIYTKR